ncbi:sulfite oxidase heme-binding subunit YedZ [Roseateles sp. BYS180W]|uniref:Protein-methionine-sulfoxide reductase heme-binding subunit MsrQ n=1 Tax=Roseateles rivi TaxID=3299028 RepID=A0ABW7FRS5_9BURK
MLLLPLRVQTRLNPLLRQRWVGRSLTLLCAAPLIWLFAAALLQQLGPNPAEALIRGLGNWALRFLWLTLCISPLRRACGLTALAPWRRHLGLWAFAYASLHLLAYAWLDMGWALADITRDIAKRPFIWMGLACWVGLLILAATSTKAAKRALGGLRWQQLHRAVYAIAIAVLLHYIWVRSGKRLYSEPQLWGALLALLLVERLWRRFSASPPR